MFASLLGTAPYPHRFDKPVMQIGLIILARPIAGVRRANLKLSSDQIHKLRVEVDLGAITTPSGVFQPEFVVHGLAESLLAAKITFGSLNRCMSEQKLNLLKFSTR